MFVHVFTKNVNKHVDFDATLEFKILNDSNYFKTFFLKPQSRR